MNIRNPEWVGKVLPVDTHYPDMAAQMRLCLMLASENITRQTGGPFAAAVFEIKSGRLVACGVNQVVPQKCSLLHAEMVALMLAQKTLGSHDLSTMPLRLVSTAAPCIQCYGATYWSGIGELVCGARKEDVESMLGFDEGPLPENWASGRCNRKSGPPLQVIKDVLREKAIEVLQAYRDDGGQIYNPGK